MDATTIMDMCWPLGHFTPAQRVSNYTHKGEMRLMSQVAAAARRGDAGACEETNHAAEPTGVRRGGRREDSQEWRTGRVTSNSCRLLLRGVMFRFVSVQGLDSEDRHHSVIRYNCSDENSGNYCHQQCPTTLYW